MYTKPIDYKVKPAYKCHKSMYFIYTYAFINVFFAKYGYKMHFTFMVIPISSLNFLIIFKSFYFILLSM